MNRNIRVVRISGYCSSVNFITLLRYENISPYSPSFTVLFSLNLFLHTCFPIQIPPHTKPTYGMYGVIRPTNSLTSFLNGSLLSKSFSNESSFSTSSKYIIRSEICLTSVPVTTSLVSSSCLVKYFF